MIDASPSLEAAKGISGRDLVAYLVEEGWTSRPSKVDGIMVISKEVSDTHERAELIVPVKAGNSDERQRVADALRAVSQIEGCSEAQVADKIRRAIGVRLSGSKSTPTDNADLSDRTKDIATASAKTTKTTGSNFWVIGGEFGSMNFHKLVEGSARVQGPFKTRKEAEDAWRAVSEENRHKAGVRFSIFEGSLDAKKTG